MTQKRWLAVYTKPRWEKKVDLLLREKGVESYCPLNKIRRKWSDRMKLVEEPLFKSYVFVHITEEEEKKVRRVEGILNFVYWLGKPAVITPLEIKRIKKFLNQYEDILAESKEVKPNDAVVINAGVFMDNEARVIRNLGKRVELEITSLGYKLIAYVDRKQLALIKK
ncbi:MAG: UpxY family transcription antiterminator [Chitinophagaceae bacterium]